MKKLILAAAIALAPLASWAETKADTVRDVITQHILPRYSTLAETSDELAARAQADCSAASEALRRAYNSAFDAWIAVSHLRFGPSELNNRAFALAYWPDSRGATPKTLAALIADADPAANTPDTFAEISIAGRGFYALEFLLYDDQLSTMGSADYRCALVKAVTADIAAQSRAILDDWQQGYADTLLSPTDTSPYRSTEEVAQELFKALNVGLEFTADIRIGRPMGTFDRPRPTRAETWRSGRSLRNVVLSLNSLEDLALRLSQSDPALADKFKRAFANAAEIAAQLDDPVFAGAAEPQSRLHIEVLQQAVTKIRTIANTDLGPLLGVASGFNALDGD
ncbi:MAG TPA: peptidase M75 [Roseobacter sp.]|uniref:Imelysin-like domain-containing protein n=1 Tax=marine sediment metagenome TaxID=412755 RepID=A0A0F9QVG9_9ZZZZ|nr:peptidase M75 [Roseobacter sp.]HEC71584.1 peptidase M75 [Roseobacter sp.]